MFFRSEDRLPEGRVADGETVVAQHNHIYKRAVYYDIVFDRDVSGQIEFARAAYRHLHGGDLGSLLDICCGPGYHARAGARAGLRAVGLDLRPEMTVFAAEAAARDGVSVDWVVGDMRDFALSQPVDLALCVYDGIDALLTHDDLTSHFRAVAANLTPRGLYAIECIHPRECSYYRYGVHRHRGERDGTSVDIVIGDNNPVFDPVNGTARVRLDLHVRRNGSTRTFSEEATEHVYSAPEIQLVADRSGALDIVGWYGEMDLDQPFDNSPQAKSMVVILQKRPPKVASVPTADDPPDGVGVRSPSS